MSSLLSPPKVNAGEFKLLLERCCWLFVSTRESEPPGFGIVKVVFADFIWLVVLVMINCEKLGFGETEMVVEPPRSTLPPPIMLLPAFIVIVGLAKAEFGMLL